MENKNPNYSIVIPSAEKDFNKLPYLLKSINENLKGFNEIIISVRNLKTVPAYLFSLPIDILEDKQILDIDTTKFRYRQNWIYQQYLKLFQNVTKNDLFLTIDSDVIFNRPMPMFTEEGKRLLHLGWEQNHFPYFAFQEKMLNLPRVYPHTFINDMNFMSKEIIKEMLDRNGYTVDSFVKRSYDVIIGPPSGGSRNATPECCWPAEPEIWGQYVMKYHSDKYEPRQAKTVSEGRLVPRIDNIGWTEKEIEAKIAEMKTKDYDMFSIHTWFDMVVI